MICQILELQLKRYQDKRIMLRGWVQAFQVGKHDFDLWVGGDGLDMYQQLEGGFGSMRAILTM